MSKFNEYLEMAKSENGKIKLGTADFVIIGNVDFKMSKDDQKFAIDNIMKANKCDIKTATNMMNTVIKHLKDIGSVITYGGMDATEDKEIELFKKNVLKSKFFYSVNDYGNTLAIGTQKKIDDNLIDLSSAGSLQEETKASIEELIQSNIEEDEEDLPEDVEDEE